MRFINVIGSDFEETKQNFQIGLKKCGYEFDEDLFVDVCMKCNNVLKDRELTKKECIKYLWVAYVNTLKRIKTNQIYITSLDCILKTEEIGEGICVDEYNEDKDKLCEFILNAIKEKFGESVAKAWRLHICDGISYKELEREFVGMKFNFEFKRIKKYILNNLAKTDKIFIELMSCLND